MATDSVPFGRGWYQLLDQEDRRWVLEDVTMAIAVFTHTHNGGERQDRFWPDVTLHLHDLKEDGWCGYLLVSLLEAPEVMALTRSLLDGLNWSDTPPEVVREFLRQEGYIEQTSP